MKQGEGYMRTREVCGQTNVHINGPYFTSGKASLMREKIVGTVPWPATLFADSAREERIQRDRSPCKVLGGPYERVC